MTQPDKVLYTAKVHTVGGRAGGVSKSNDGRLEIKHSQPGGPGDGTNPEQLFAAGWSACFEGAMGVAARRLQVELPSETAIDAEVDLCSTGGEFTIRARLNIQIPGVERNVGQQIVDTAHQICPYSKATRGNIDVVLNLI